MSPGTACGPERQGKEDRSVTRPPRQWAFTLLEQAVLRLGREFVAAGKGAQFHRLKEFLTRKVDYGQYPAVATELGLSPAAVSLTVHRMRQRYRELVRAEMAHTVAGPEELDEEMRYLFTVIRGEG